MTSFFPPLYKDELLYSALARYHQRSGYESCKEILKELFNKSTITAISDFPGEIGVLCENIDLVNITPFNLIYEHTLLPYYLPFITEDLGHKIKHQMIEGNSIAISVALGLAASKIKETNFFRFCVNCFIEETTIYGEPYWHRTHQLPGVLVCPKHKKALIETRIPYRNKQNKHRFFTLDENSIKYGEEILISNKCFNNFVFIAEQSYRLLNDSHLLKGIESVQGFYHKQLQKKGYLTASNRLRMKELIPSFLRTFDPELLKSLNSHFNENDEDTWFHKALRKPRVACHPLRHLLLLLFLKEEMPNKKDIIEYHPFGKGPWPCLNKAANHYKETVISDCVVTTDSKTKQPVGTFKCKHCHFIYSRRGPDLVEKDKYKIGRVKNFGQVWINKLNYLDSLGDYSTRGIASILGVDSKTAKKYLGNNKISNEDEINKTKVNKPDKYNMAEKHKRDFMTLIEANPGFSRTELRRANPSGYTWLYRNEKEWLWRILPMPQKNNRSVNVKINWGKRDQDYSLLLIKEAINILTEAPLIRLTKTRIAKRLDLQSRFENYIDKLPICKSILDDVAEAIEDFQIRRIRFYADKLRKENKTYTKSSLSRAAGLKSSLSDTVQIIVLDELKKLEKKIGDLS